MITHDASDAIHREAKDDPNLGHGDIAQLAYHLWLERGCPEGCPNDDWYRAEQELARRHDERSALKMEG
jgi:hypothetical protein